jgi:transposase
LKRHVAEILVCDPRQVHLLRNGTKTDRNDATKLAELLRLGALRPVYHGDAATERLRALVRHYLTLTDDVIRVKLRLRAVYRSAAVRLTGASIYREGVRREHLTALRRYPTHRLRAAALFRQHDALVALLAEARVHLIAAALANPAYLLLQSIPYVGEIRAAILVAAIGTPERFPNLRQFWAYAGLAVRIHASGEHRFVDGGMRRVAGAARTRGLTMSYSRPLKRVLREIAMSASAGFGPLRRLSDEALRRGLRRPVARTVVARKVASIVFAVWRTGEAFDPERLHPTESCPEGASTEPVAERH